MTRKLTAAHCRGLSRTNHRRRRPDMETVADTKAEPAPAAAGEDAAAAEAVAKEEGANVTAEAKDAPAAAAAATDGGAEGGDGKVANNYRKRKVALMFGYVGKGYNGMQRNPGVWTIEDEMEKGLSAAGVIAPEDVGDFSKARYRSSVLPAAVTGAG